jgi:predicted membrane channel-forming protein YqfA (hemolysin III family)
MDAPAEPPIYQRILPVGLLRVLAVVSFVASIVLILVGLFDPIRFENNVARFMLCLAVSTLLAIFFFIFYPERIETQLPEAVGLSVRVGGPVALWIGVFLFLWNIIPSPEYTRVFEVVNEGRRGAMYLGDSKTTYFTVDDPGEKAPNHWLIGETDGGRHLYGILVVFPPNVREIKARLHHEGWVESLPVKLSRTGSNVIDVSSVQKRVYR